MKVFLLHYIRFTTCFLLIFLCKETPAQSLCDSLNISFTAYGPSCNGYSNGSVNLTISGGAIPYSFNWSTGSATEDVSGLTAGTYSVVVTDLNSCMDTAYITLTQPAPLVNTLTIQNVLCNGGSTGLIYSNVSGGTEDYNYFWSNGFTSANLIYMPAGSYVITIVDYLGCTTVDTAVIQQPDPISLTLFSPEPIPGYNVSSYLGTDGSIDLTVSGGVTPYTYIWSNAATTEDLASLAAGPYDVMVTDSNSCTASASIVLDQPTSIEMPSAFSPNNDGNNDNFIIHGIDGSEENQLTIFNRWGNIVYQKENYNNQWNGFNNQGEELADGTYFAIFEIKAKELVLQSYVEMKRH